MSEWIQHFDLQGWQATAASAGGLVLAVLAGLLAQALVLRLARGWAVRTPFLPDDLLVNYWKRPARLLIPVLFAVAILPTLQFPAGLLAFFRHLISLLIIAGVAWLGVQTVFALRDVVLARYDIRAQDNLRARAVFTQIQVVERVLVVAILVVAMASMLMTFEKIRQVGVSMLASAGIAGVVLGFAAQKSMGAIFAGIQVAITQPIRIDDVVIVEGQWGRIEEIALTYVVVRIWDLRRLVVPITYFITNPVENWTRVSANLLGTVFLYADYTVPVDEVREELHRILQESQDWDREAWGLQVTNASDRTVELRALMSARDSGTAWNLRCQVREKLLAFLQSRYPESLPRVRAEFRGAGPEAGVAPAGEQVG